MIDFSVVMCMMVLCRTSDMVKCVQSFRLDRVSKRIPDLLNQMKCNDKNPISITSVKQFADDLHPCGEVNHP